MLYRLYELLRRGLILTEPWLERFRFGPFEWLWRVATYRKLQPIRR